MDFWTTAEEYLLDDALSDIPEMKKHRFSLWYRSCKRRIIRSCPSGESMRAVKHAVKIRYAVIAVMLACAMLLAGAGGLTQFGIFGVTQYDIYSMLYLIDETGNAPETIEKKLYLDADMSGYEKKVIDDMEYTYWIRFKDGDKILSISQYTFEFFGQARINTENTLVFPEECSLNGWNGVYYQTFNGTHVFFFDTGEYVVSYVSNIDKSELEKMVKSTKF